MEQNGWLRLLALSLVAVAAASPAPAQDKPAEITVHWDKITRVSQTTPTLQVVVNPPLERGTAIHDNVFRALHDLGADYVRYVPWLPYPKLGVAELKPPAGGRTSWDFTNIDPITIDFLEATKGHSVILNFSTIPQWMYKTEKPVSYPSDPNQVTWNYEQGTELRDPSAKEVADYYARLLAWYTMGGFTDEAGKRHESGYHYSIPYWEVLNEVDFEHNTSAKSYTQIYDATVAALRRVQPQIKFVGMALATPGDNPAFFDYFLNHKNHKPGIPLDFISFHFYAVPTADQSLEVQQFTFFAQADGFLDVVRFVESVRQRLSPETRTTIDEIGAISSDDIAQFEPNHVTQPIPNAYWNLAGAMYAYIFAQLTRIGVDVAGESQLVGYPTQFPSVSMVDWNTGQPNARYWVLKLLHENFGPGDKLVEIAPSGASNPYVYSLAAVTRDGQRRVLLVNKRNRPIDVSIAGAKSGQEGYVDQSTALRPPAARKLESDRITLNGFAVAVVTLP
jgi:hypothetical protein